MTTPTRQARSQANSSDNAATSGTQIYVVTPSKLKELGFVTRIENGKTVLVPKTQPTNVGLATSKPLLVSVEAKGKQSFVSPNVIIPQSKSPQTESPGRRRILQGFSKHWVTSLENRGFIKCPLRLCTYISLRYEDMCQHYASCNGLANNAEFLCNVCKCCLREKEDLMAHIARSHGPNSKDINDQPTGSRSPVVQAVQRREEHARPEDKETRVQMPLCVRKRGHNKVHKQVWTGSLEKHGHVQCHFKNCNFMALSLEEMIDHYRSCNLILAGQEQTLYQCPHCKGKVASEAKLAVHMERTHGVAPVVPMVRESRRQPDVTVCRKYLSASEGNERKNPTRNAAHTSDGKATDKKPLLSDKTTRLTQTADRSFTISKDEVEIRIPEQNAFDNSIVDPLLTSMLVPSSSSDWKRNVTMQHLTPIRGHPLKEELTTPPRCALKEKFTSPTPVESHKLSKQPPSDRKIAKGSSGTSSASEVHSNVQNSNKKVCSFWKGAVTTSPINANKKVCTFLKTTSLIDKQISSSPLKLQEEDPLDLKGMEAQSTEAKYEASFADERLYDMHEVEVIEEYEISTAPLEYTIGETGDQPQYFQGADDRLESNLLTVEVPSDLPMTHIDPELSVGQVKQGLPIEQTTKEFPKILFNPELPIDKDEEELALEQDAPKSTVYQRQLELPLVPALGNKHTGPKLAVDPRHQKPSVKKIKHEKLNKSNGQAFPREQDELKSSIEIFEPKFPIEHDQQAFTIDQPERVLLIKAEYAVAGTHHAESKPQVKEIRAQESAVALVAGDKECRLHQHRCCEQEHENVPDETGLEAREDTIDKTPSSEALQLIVEETESASVELLGVVEEDEADKMPSSEAQPCIVGETESVSVELVAGDAQLELQLGPVGKTENNQAKPEYKLANTVSLTDKKECEINRSQNTDGIQDPAAVEKGDEVPFKRNTTPKCTENIVSTDVRKTQHDSVSKSVALQSVCNRVSVSTKSVQPIIGANAYPIQPSSDSISSSVGALRLPSESTLSATEALQHCSERIGSYVEPTRLINASNSKHSLTKIRNISGDPIHLQTEPSSKLNNSVQTMSDPIGTQKELIQQITDPMDCSVETVPPESIVVPSNSELHSSTSKRTVEQCLQEDLEESLVTQRVDNEVMDAGLSDILLANQRSGVCRYGQMPEGSVGSARQKKIKEIKSTASVKGGAAASGNTEDILPAHVSEHGADNALKKKDRVISIRKKRRPPKMFNTVNVHEIKVPDSMKGIQEVKIGAEIPIYVATNISETDMSEVLGGPCGAVDKPVLLNIQREHVPPLQANLHIVDHEVSLKDKILSFGDVNVGVDPVDKGSTRIEEGPVELTPMEMHIKNSTRENEELSGSEQFVSGYQDIEKTGTDKEKIEHIKHKQLVREKKRPSLIVAIPGAGSTVESCEIQVKDLCSEGKMEISSNIDPTGAERGQTQVENVGACKVNVSVSKDDGGYVRYNEENVEAVEVDSVMLPWEGISSFKKSLPDEDVDRDDSEEANEDQDAGQPIEKRSCKSRVARKSLRASKNNAFVPPKVDTIALHGSVITDVAPTKEQEARLSTQTSSTAEKGKETYPTGKKKRARPPKKSFVAPVLSIPEPTVGVDLLLAQKTEENKDIIASTKEKSNKLEVVHSNSSIDILLEPSRDMDRCDIRTIDTNQVTDPPIKKKRSRQSKCSLVASTIDLPKTNIAVSVADVGIIVANPDVVVPQKSSRVSLTPVDSSSFVENLEAPTSQDVDSYTKMIEMNEETSLPVKKRRGRTAKKSLVSAAVILPDPGMEINDGDAQKSVRVSPDISAPTKDDGDSLAVEDLSSIAKVTELTKEKDSCNIKTMGMNQETNPPVSAKKRGRPPKKSLVSSGLDVLKLNENGKMENVKENPNLIAPIGNKKEGTFAGHLGSVSGDLSESSRTNACVPVKQSPQENITPLKKKRGRPPKNMLVPSEAGASGSTGGAGDASLAPPIGKVSKGRSKQSIIIASDVDTITTSSVDGSSASDLVDDGQATDTAPTTSESYVVPELVSPASIKSPPGKEKPLRFSSRGRQLRPKLESYDEGEDLSEDSPRRARAKRVRSEQASFSGDSCEAPKPAKKRKMGVKRGSTVANVQPDAPLSENTSALTHVGGEKEEETPAADDVESTLADDQVASEGVSTAAEEDGKSLKSGKKKKKRTVKQAQRLARLKNPIRNRPKSIYAAAEDAVEEVQGPLTSKTNVNCGKCGEEMKQAKFKAHAKSMHGGLAWIQGYPPLDLSDSAHVRYTLLKFWKPREKKTIACETCGTKKKSIEGFISHIELICQKSHAEQEALRVACPYCDRCMMKSSLKVHIGTTHRSGLPEEEEQARPVRELGKRAAATKAETLVLKYMKEESGGISADGDNDDKEQLYKRSGGMRQLAGSVMIRYRKEIESNGVAKCIHNGCSYQSPDLAEIRKHYGKCLLFPAMSFDCTKCSFFTESEDEIKQHVATEHVETEEDEASEEDEAPDSDFAGISESNSDLDDVYMQDVKPHRRGQSILKLVKPMKFTSQIKFLADDFTHLMRGDRPYSPAAKWTLQFQEENYMETLFDLLHSTLGDWTPLDEEEALRYMPVTQESVPVAYLINEYKMQDPRLRQDLQWRSLKQFEAAVVDNVPVFFAGGPVWAMAWLPIPNRRFVQATGNVSQVLAVSCHRGMDDAYAMDRSHAGPGLIQLWQFEQLDNITSCTSAPVMVLGLAHNSGTVWHMEWCPSGCYEDFQEKHPGRLSRMGLLAAACSDGAVHLFSVPFPAQLQATPHNVHATTPVVSLVLGRTTTVSMCIRLSWHGGKRHRYVTASYTNGMVVVWDLETTSPFLTETRNRTQFIYPHVVFQAHLGPVTALSLCPHGGFRYLLTGGTDRSSKVWDLEQTPPVVISRSGKGCVNNAVWLTHWLSTVTVYDDAFGIHHTNAMLQPVRNFGYSTYPFLAQNSPVWSVTYSDWSNAVAHGTAAGELCAIFPHQLFIGIDTEKGLKEKRMVISYIEMIESCTTNEGVTSVEPGNASQAEGGTVNPVIDRAIARMVIDPVMKNAVRFPLTLSRMADLASVLENTTTIITSHVADEQPPARSPADQDSVAHAVPPGVTVDTDNVQCTVSSMPNSASAPSTMNSVITRANLNVPCDINATVAHDVTTVTSAVTPVSVSDNSGVACTASPVSPSVNASVPPSAVCSEQASVQRIPSPTCDRMDVEEDNSDDGRSIADSVATYQAESITDSVATYRPSSVSTSMFGGSKDVSVFGETDDGEGNEESYMSDDDNTVAISRANVIGVERPFLPDTYADITQRFKLVFCNTPLDDFKKIPQEARQMMRMSEKMRSVPTEMYPITSINRVAWNPNCSSHLWLASGYQCGLVRVPCMQTMYNKYTDNLLKTTNT